MIFLLLSLLGLVPTFQKSKCKKLLNTTLERIKLLSSRRDAQLRHLRGDLAKLLQLGKEQKAQVWEGRIWKELQLRSVYVNISAYCRRLQVNLTNIAGRSECPENVQEPLAGLCFAASCCADLPELQELREIFTMKYGKNFVASAHELGRKCLVKEGVEEIAADDDELKQHIEHALQKQKEQEMQARMDGENCDDFSLPQHEEGSDFVLTSVQVAPQMQKSAIARLAFEEDMGTAQVASLSANQIKTLKGQQACSANVRKASQKKRQKIHGEDPETSSQGHDTATTQRCSGSNMELALYVKQPEFSLPPQRPPPLPSGARLSTLPKRSASMPSFSRYIDSDSEIISPNLSPHHCPTMAKNQYRENCKGIHVHPRLPKYEDLVANFTALKHDIGSARHAHQRTV